MIFPDLSRIEQMLNNPGERYHLWYYNQNIWRTVSFMGVYAAKNVLDLWNYQEILSTLRPGLVVEFGTYEGGTALYFSWLMKFLSYRGGNPSPVVLTVDNGQGGALVSPVVRNDPDITVLTADSISAECQRYIRCYLDYLPTSPAFFILDSDHSMDHVLAELEMLRSLTRPGDYVVVEDSNINGHPVLVDFGPGPWEAIERYEEKHPGDYRHDTEREQKFGFTFAPRGYLIRQ
jgi:cephalosporin hydroxylase